MIDTILMALFSFSGFLIVYHHALFPWWLNRLAKKLELNQTINKQTQSSKGLAKVDELPTITMLIPVFNEANFMADKLQNLAILDYPADKLKFILAFDGCSDDSLQIAEETLAQPQCKHLQVELREFKQNRGKLAIMQEVLPIIDAEITAMSDVSALISMDALKRVAEDFMDAKVGVVTGHYQLLAPLTENEKVYWQYQSNIKRNEAKFASTLGAHGALYFFRSKLRPELPENTINDDFLLPMLIVKQGYQAVYNEHINALELEGSSTEIDFKRRLRISAGNTQQIGHLLALLNPKYGRVFVLFFSGKVLRWLTPYLLILMWLSSFVLAFNSVLFLALFILQTLFYGWFFYLFSNNLKPQQKLLKMLHYLLLGHYAGLLGSFHYLFNSRKIVWSSKNLEK